MSFREFINEIKITKSDSEKYEIKDGIIHITKKEFDKIPKDYKSDKTILTKIDGVTKSVPYKIIMEDEILESNEDKIIDKLYGLVGTDNKIDDFMWDFFEKNIHSIYAGDAIPDDYIEYMDEKDRKLAVKLYTELQKKFKIK
jgi:hypothetical protein